MIHPRSLSIAEPRPSKPEWRCTVHGDLEPGESCCSHCDEPSLLARAWGGELP